MTEFHFKKNWNFKSVQSVQARALYSMNSGRMPFGYNVVMAGLLCFTLICSFFIIFRPDHASFFSHIVLGLLIAFYSMMIARLMLTRALKKHVTWKRKDQDIIDIYEFTYEQITITSPVRKAVFDWQFADDIFVCKKYVTIFLKGHGIVIEKHDFKDDAQMESFVNFCYERTGLKR